MIWSDGVAVEWVVALHVNGVVGDTADAEMNEIINVEALAGDAAVRSEQDTERVGTATKEDLRIGKVGNLFPGHLRVPRKVGPLTWSGAGISLGDVPRDGFKIILNVARASPKFHGD